MTTDNRTNEPTEAQVEAAAKVLLRDYQSEYDGGEVSEFLDVARAALVAAQGAAPARPVIAREAVAREVYRELYPGPIGTHDSKRTPESDMAEADRAYLTWDNGNEGFAPGAICRRVADRVIAQLQSAPVLPSIGVDEDALAEVIGRDENYTRDVELGGWMLSPRLAARAVTEWLREGR